MTKGDIVRMPSGRYAQYLDGILGQGADFCYLDEHGNPARSPHDRNEWDKVTIGSNRLLIQWEMARISRAEWDRL